MADNIATDFISKVKAKGKQAMSWFRDIVKQTQRSAFPASTGRAELMDERNTGVTGRPSIGRLYLFQYDAKYKETLPYWDVWPLIFPFNFASNGFYGINLHYLPPNARIDLMLRLIKAQGGSGNVSENYKLKLSYDIITTYPPAIPCIKRYLFNHVQGKGFYGIKGEDWSYAAALPLQKFRGAGNNTVWGDSKAFY
jgi:hypothetical protein